MAEIDTSIYKPQPQQNPLDQITKIGGAANALGDLAVGGAMQQSIDPASGEVDQNKLISLLKQSPVGAMKAVPTLDAIQKLRNAGFTADQAGLDAFQKRMGLTYHLFSGLASKAKPTMDDVHDIAASALDPAFDGKKYGVTVPVVMNAVKALRDAFTQGGSAGLKKKALEIQTQAATTQEILHQHSPQGQWVNQGGQWVFVPIGTAANPATGTAVPNTLPPTTEEATPFGTRYRGEQPPVPGGGAVGPGGQPLGRPVQTQRIAPGQPGGATPGAPVQTAGGPPAVSPGGASGPMSSLPPGTAEAMKSTAEAGAASANALTQANDSSMTRKALLGNLEDLVGKFTPGKGSDWTLVAKNFASRNLPVPKSWQETGGTFDLKSVASQEEFNKQSMQLAQAQFATIGGTGTDAKFNSAFETSPNQLLSSLGNIGIIRLLKGNEDAIQAKNKSWRAWLKAGHTPDTWADFSANFNDHFDPRVFQFKYLPVKERQAYVDKMNDEEHDKFMNDMAYANKMKWIDFGMQK